MRLLKLAAIPLLIFYVTFAQASSHRRCTSPLCPNRESLIRQNLVINQMGLERIQNEQEVSDMVAQGKLRALPITEALRVSPSLPQERRYVSPFVVPFLLSLSEQCYAKFGKPLTVDSAVRPKSVQERLRRINYSAAPVDGETASSHEAGTTFDLSKKMPKAQLQWLRNILSMYQAYNVVIAEEEKNCMHIQVIGETE